MPKLNNMEEKRRAAREVIDILEEMSVLLVGVTCPTLNGFKY